MALDNVTVLSGRFWTFLYHDYCKFALLLDWFWIIRELSAAYGKSRQLIFVYLEALASIGMVGIDNEGYYAISKDRLLNLGRDIQPGILRELRTAAGIKPKSRNQN